MSDSIGVGVRQYVSSLRVDSSPREVGADQLTNERRPWAEALLYSVVLSLMFVLVYGGCNALASGRTDLATRFFEWELKIPFVPALIVPYMSIDLFFVASFLLCADRIELRAHARRVALAILIAGLAFLVFPLTAGYPRPEVSGWTGSMFEFLWSFDKPHNLVPSLHVALASLLWPVYARRTDRLLRWFVYMWFTLILVSPLLTWQHHLLDVATGAMLGQVCLFAFPERRNRGHISARRRDRSLVRSSPNLRVAGFYAVGSAALGIPAIALGTWCWLLLWPASSLALVAVAYVRGDSAVFRKTDGQLPMGTRIVLGPYLLGTFARLLIYRSGEPFAEAAPGVYCGRLLTKREALAVRRMGVVAVLDLTAEHAETRGFLAAHTHASTCASERRETGSGLSLLEGKPDSCSYLNVPMLDLTRPSREQMRMAVEFIESHARRGGVYVHCALGISRSAAVVSDYLASRQARPQQACLCGN